MKGYRSWAEISKDRVEYNLKLIHNYVKKDIFAVVKADAYGHGAENISRILQQYPFVQYLCVATAEEGKELRQAGIKKDILVLGGILPDEIKCFKDYDLVPVISDFNQLQLVQKYNISRIHIKFDTGMHRLGFLPEEIDQVLNSLNGLNVEGILSHFPSADIDPELTEKQIKQFQKIVEMVKKAGINPRYIHLQNSAGLMYKCDYCNAVRIGISIYGEKSAPNFSIPVKTVMSVKSKVIAIKNLKKGETVSYAGTFTAPKDMKIAIVSFGYADGLPRDLSNKGYFLINHQKANIIGNVTMDMTIVDVSHIKNIKIGDTVTVVGKDNGNEIYFEDIARLCGTIPYEIMCRISKRVKRVVI